jgi:hypothetical protein
MHKYKVTMTTMRIFIFAFFVFFSLQLFSQGPVLSNLNRNIYLNKSNSQNNSKRSITDTIQLPFFEDFTSSNFYPNMKYWRDSLVYINNQFSVSPPSYGVATFDNLDKKGKPYQSLNGLNHNHSDSLTSNFINLKNYKNGLNTISYSVADSIYLSFFYQTQGIGDPLDNSDSLVLKFKDLNGFWKTVWKTTGSSVKPFKQVLVGVLSPNYLNSNFQFRFVNYGKTTGNMNQWHIDYVRMKSSRNRYDTLVNDVAINAEPIGPLQIYESMPYDHFKANAPFNQSAFHTVKLRNNNNTSVNVQYKCEVRNVYNKIIVSYPLSSSARNVSRFSDSSENFTSFRFDTLSGKSPLLKLKYTIAPLANDFTPDNYNSIGNNNEYTKTVKFSNYFAYDDGSAEGGYGLDYGSLPAGPGYAAIKFSSFKPDTLRGISVFFNRSIADVQFKSFNLIVWKAISEPPANNTNSDIILKRFSIPSTVYTDSINGFTNFIFDTAVLLPQGSFYIGWQQNTSFILNVGYDNNYKYAKSGGTNPNLFYNLNGYWEKVSANITGAVMMRPLVGREIKVNNPSNVLGDIKAPNITIYPNPSSKYDLVFVKASTQIRSIKVYDCQGKLQLEVKDENIEKLNISNLNNGIYFFEIIDEFNQTSFQKWIKQSYE